MSEERREESDEAASGSRELEPAAQILARLEKLEQYNSDLEAKLIEQEHRLIPLWRNWFSFSHYGADEPTDAVELRFWKDRRSASRWALFWRFVSPETAATAGISGLALLGAYFAYEANGYLRQQNKKFDTQNGLVELQNDYFQEQIDKTQLQIEAQASEAYLGRRASLIGTLYDRTNCELAAKEKEENDSCPLRASPRARQDALDALVQIERVRSPIPAVPNRNAGQAVPLGLAHLDLKGADLKRVDLIGANLNEADLIGADLREANLMEANLMEANLMEAKLMEADLRGADLTRANLEGAKLRRAKLMEAVLYLAKLSGARLREADLREANLGGADLRGATFSGANLREANLRNADLTGAYLSGADLRGARLRKADLRDADLRDADLTGAELWGAIIGTDDLLGPGPSGPMLRAMVPRGPKNLTQKQVDSAAGDSKTLLPPGIERPEHWK